MPSGLISKIAWDTQVRDYDQLSPMANQILDELADDGTTITVASRSVACFDRHEIINYTDYLRIDT